MTCLPAGRLVKYHETLSEDGLPAGRQGYFHMAATAEQLTFEQRNHLALRGELTLRAVGHTAVEGAQSNYAESHEVRRRDELCSTLAEGLKGQIDTHYSFSLAGDKLVAADGEPTEEMLVRALREDIKLANSDRSGFYDFLPQRSRAELDNFRLTQNMALGNTPGNTMLEVSVYTEEKATSVENKEKLRVAAQKPYWGRTMVRLSHWDGKEMHIITLSSDNLPAAEMGVNESTRSLPIFKEAALRTLGYEFTAEDSTEMLAEPIVLTVHGDSWKTIAHDLVGEVDNILAEKFGGQWVQGRPPEEKIDLQRYVESQSTIVNGLLAESKRLALVYPKYEEYAREFENKIYNCIALLEERLMQGRTEEEVVDYHVASSNAGAVARAEGKTYDACGMVLNANTSSEAAAAGQTGRESLMRLAGKKLRCYECKEEVVVATEKLKSGRLCCPACKYEVDVCTGQVYAKSQKGAGEINHRPIGAYEAAAYEFKKDIQRIDQEIAAARAVEREIEQQKVAA